MGKYLEDELEALLDNIYPTGSREICHPPPMNTDQDYIACCYDSIQLKRLRQYLKETGWTVEKDGKYGNEADISFRKGDINLIVTRYRETFDGWVLATRLAKRFNLRIKQDRINLFQAIINGSSSPRIHIFEARLYD